MRHGTFRHGFTSEADLGKVVVQYLKDLGWDVYQEVTTSWSNHVADIVATKGPLIWVIECKLVFGLEVIEQAFHWQDRAHLVSVAVPCGRRWPETVCRRFGVGVLSVSPVHTGRLEVLPNVREEVEPEFRRRVDDKNFRASLSDYQKTYAQAGNAEGKCWTPFRETCKNVVDAVKEAPGILIKDLVDKIKHHYSSHAVARQSIPHWIRAGLIEGVRIELDKGKLRLYPGERKEGKHAV